MNGREENEMNNRKIEWMDTNFTFQNHQTHSFLQLNYNGRTFNQTKVYHSKDYLTDEAMNITARSWSNLHSHNKQQIANLRSIRVDLFWHRRNWISIEFFKNINFMQKRTEFDHFQTFSNRKANTDTHTMYLTLGKPNHFSIIFYNFFFIIAALKSLHLPRFSIIQCVELEFFKPSNFMQCTTINIIITTKSINISISISLSLSPPSTKHSKNACINSCFLSLSNITTASIAVVLFSLVLLQMIYCGTLPSMSSGSTAKNFYKEF